MKDLKYYDQRVTSYKSQKEFIQEFETELDEFVGTRAQLKEKEVKLKEIAINNYWNNQQKIREERHQKHFVEFKADLAETYKISDHPKLDKLFDMAWERGHSEGLNSVEIEFAELSELLDPNVKDEIQ
ncbi:MAG: hypothetical protein ACC656_07120 [Candidatus Heimdallarchaeota archaeon]